MLAFDVVKRKRPSVKVKRLVRPLGNRCPGFWPCLPARPGEGQAFPCTLITNNKPDNKRQQTLTVDYKRLFNGLVLTGFASLRQKLKVLSSWKHLNLYLASQQTSMPLHREE